MRAPRRSFCLAAALFALIAIAACQPRVQDAPAPPAAPSAPPAASTSLAAAPASAALAAPEEEPLPEIPAVPEGASGPAFVLVDHVGVLRIDDGKVATVIRLPDSASSTWSASLVAGPGGELWMSDWDGVRVLDPGGTVRTVRRTAGAVLYEHLLVRSPGDVWAVTSDIEWTVMHYDGKRWSPVRNRKQFPGKFDDNKLDGIEITKDAVWVSTWNGLWRGAGEAWKKGADWQKIAPPEGNGRALFLYVLRDQLVACFSGGYFVREGEGWRKLGWPERAGHPRAISDLGLGVAQSADKRRIVIAPVDGKGRIVTSEAIQGRGIHDVAIDQSGRVWVATDYAIAVVDRAGKIAAEWTPGTLPGFTGKAMLVAVVGAGPARLPAAAAAPGWEIVGRMEVYKRGAPLAGAWLELCPDPDEELGCKGAPFVRSATTGADGSFRFQDVPEGDFRIHVRPPAGEKDCGGLFRIMGDTVNMARDCKPASGAGAAAGGPRRCDLGKLTQCLPFEMPPPH